MLLPESAAAERNKNPILEVLRDALPRSGTVLEIASGTGQHAVHFAAALPGLTWQPTDADPAQLAIVAARIADSRLANVLEPLALDVQDERWTGGRIGGPYDALVCINMLHVAPWTATGALFGGAARHLQPAAPLLIYGPFREGGRHTAPSNEAFDRSLRERDASWGVRDLGEVSAEGEAAGFDRVRVVRMPANNLCVVFAAGAPRT
jgi:cyclopropane fatty-acyl-phospholipid synthase-like methyltransferase